MKKVLIISTSLRAGSNSEIAAKEVEKGSKEAGNDVEFVTLKDKNIAFCKGCLACQKLGRCIIDDDANPITDKIASSEVIVFVTPIYYYEMSGQMKTLIDRANSLYVREKKFKEVYLVTTSAEDEDYVIDGALKGLQGWVDCFDGVELKGHLSLGGFNDPQEIKNHDRLKEAYEFGRKL